jgi:hypothetical protein
MYTIWKGRIEKGRNGKGQIEKGAKREWGELGKGKTSIKWGQNYSYNNIGLFSKDMTQLT